MTKKQIIKKRFILNNLHQKELLHKSHRRFRFIGKRITKAIRFYIKEHKN